jgi:ipoprotein LpqH
MEIRHIAVTAAVLAVPLAGCSSPAPALGSTTAKVTIDGRDTGNPHNVTCVQTGWAWTIQTPDKDKSFTAVLDTGDKIAVRSVDFHNFGGFNGTYVVNQVGKAEVTGVGGRYTITGSAQGSFADDANKDVSATFRIEASC